MNTKTKPAAQLSLELILERNKAEAERLLAENARIETEMKKILGEVQAPSSRIVEAFQEALPGLQPVIPQHKNGEAMGRMAAENAVTLPPVSERLASERDVVYAAVAIVRSWRRRHKKTYHNQERELASAVDKLKWEK